jgi:hypothetical protein
VTVEQPASAASVQTLIIAILLHQFVEGGALRACRLELQLKPERGKQLVSFGKAQLAGASVFKRVERARLTPALRASAVWLSLSVLRRSAIWPPMEIRSSMHA